MFFKSGIKVLVSSAKITSKEDLLNVTTANTLELSGLSNINVGTNTTTHTFTEGNNTLDSDVMRGLYLEPGLTTTYSIGITAYIGLTPDRVVSNSILFSALLASSNSSIKISEPFIRNNSYNSQQLNEISVVVISGDSCTVYHNAVVNSCNIKFQLTELLEGSWTVVAATALDVTGITYSSGVLTDGITTANVAVESIAHYSPTKRSKVSVGGVQSGVSVGNLALTDSTTFTKGLATSIMQVSAATGMGDNLVGPDAYVAIFGKYLSGGIFRRYIISTKKVYLGQVDTLKLYALKGGSAWGWGDQPEYVLGSQEDTLLVQYSDDGTTWYDIYEVLPPNMNPPNSWKLVNITLPQEVKGKAGVYIKISQKNSVTNINDNWAFTFDDILVPATSEERILPPISGSLSINNNISIIPSTGMDDFGSYNGHKLGAQYIGGEVSVYTRVGDVGDTLTTLKDRYNQGERGVNNPITLRFNTANGDIVFNVGPVFIDLPDISYDSVFNTTIKYTAINYNVNDFEIYVD